MVREWNQTTYNFDIDHPKYGLVSYSYQIDINGEYMAEKILFRDLSKKLDKNSTDEYKEYFDLEDELRAFVEDYKDTTPDYLK